MAHNRDVHRVSRHVNSIAGRLSLRAPQRESLEILARVADIVPLAKGRDVEQALATIRSEYPGVTDFERDFPSLCFALATGVGKTRLMGAFVSYLHLAHGLRHFFVLAPNLTIYNKLIADFTPGNPKYVLQGIAEFSQNPPEIITGDNYGSGRGVRGVRSDIFGERDVHINIFNVSKINSEVRGGSAPRIKRLSEYIGESYFEYLAGLDDLVLLMDESHRYRASAGVKAINELRPVLGIELTATPQVETTRGVERLNMLKEGWDVTNLYTIVPLRAANARTLVEQSIGRGLRLPYGKRTGVKAVDRLTIVAHDRFQEIVDEANRPDSPIRMDTVIIGKDVPEQAQTSVVIPSYVELRMTGGAPASTPGGSDGRPGMTTHDGLRPAQQRIVFETPAEQAIAKLMLEAVEQFEYLPQSRDLRKADVHAELVRAVTAAHTPAQQEFEGVTDAPDVAEVVAKAVELFVELTIDVPRITVVPTGEVTTGFKDFDLEPLAARLQPVAEAILVHGLVDNTRDRLIPGGGVVVEDRPENYLVALLIDYPDISYDSTADLLYKLSGQMVAHLRSYLPDDEAVENVLRHHTKQLAQHIHAQMQAHRWERSTGYTAIVSKGFTQLRPIGCMALAGVQARPFREPVDDPQYIRGLRFTQFQRCLYPEQRFDSDTERRFAVLLENDSEALKWFKPGKGQLNIYYSADHSYEPDFIVETETMKYRCEPKRASEMNDPVVLAKARAAAAWCKHATAHAEAHGGKPWAYLLIEHTSITASATLAGLAATFAFDAR